MQTQRGEIAFKLFPDEAPKTVENFVSLVKKGFYDVPSMKFHRVVPGFVVQTGDPTGTGYGGSGSPIQLEAKNTLSHDKIGIVAMARGPAPNSATSQFYITLKPQIKLDGKYAIFGKVIKGLNVLDLIQQDDRVYGIQFVDEAQIQPDQPVKKKSRLHMF
ncbi:MAG: peptidylprolyl isomerase [Cyanobacteria bacterium]|nr:peptidylprolyl isomerase [Cyanobacteriota bacterium]